MNHYYFKISTYEQYKMDLLMAEHLQRKMAKLENNIHNDTNSSNEVKLYESPKRNIVCSHCGQQYYWCNCDLNIK